MHIGHSHIIYWTFTWTNLNPHPPPETCLVPTSLTSSKISWTTYGLQTPIPQWFGDIFLWDSLMQSFSCKIAFCNFRAFYAATSDGLFSVLGCRATSGYRNLALLPVTWNWSQTGRKTVEANHHTPTPHYHAFWLLVLSLSFCCRGCCPLQIASW